MRIFTLLVLETRYALSVQEFGETRHALGRAKKCVGTWGIGDLGTNTSLNPYLLGFPTPLNPYFPIYHSKFRSPHALSVRECVVGAIRELPLQSLVVLPCSSFLLLFSSAPLPSVCKNIFFLHKILKLLV